MLPQTGNFFKVKLFEIMACVELEFLFMYV